MGGILAIGAFGLTLVGIGALENAGWKVNEGALGLVMTVIKYGAILYIINLAAKVFL